MKTTEAGGPRGHNAGKKIGVCKRHALVETDGRTLMLQVHSADMQDRDATPLSRALRRCFPSVAVTLADTAYAAERVTSATKGWPRPSRQD